MKKMKITYILCFLIPHLAFSQDSLLIQAFKENAHTLQFEEGKLSGAGFEFLEDIAQTSPFFLIGEEHGIAEIPLFTAALFKAFKEYGYRYFATETGPLTAAFLQDMVARKNWITDYKAFLKTYPWSIPFYSWREECEVLDAVLASTASDDVLLWGLDQEFAASFRMNFKALEESAQTEASKKVATRFFEKANAGYHAFSTERNPNKSFMASARPSDFEELKTAFAGQPENLERIRELEESIHIYQLWFQREGYQSNKTRAEMMKRHFHQYYTTVRQKKLLRKSCLSLEPIICIEEPMVLMSSILATMFLNWPAR